LKARQPAPLRALPVGRRRFHTSNARIG
jgi:hypothetical protein